MDSTTLTSFVDKIVSAGTAYRYTSNPGSSYPVLNAASMDSVGDLWLDISDNPVP